MSNQPYVGRAGNQQILSGQVPFSQEAEEAVIGAILVNPEAFLTVASFLRAEDFYILRHSYIWEAFQRLSDRNESIDYLTVQDELRALGRLNEIGGPAFLTHLINSTPTSVHAEIYGRLVERAAIRRRLLLAADEIKSLALDEEMPIEKVTDEAESRLFRVTERRLNREIIPMREAIGEYFDRIEYLMQHHEEQQLGLPTGFKDLDSLLGGLQRSDLLIFAGRPGMGKCVAEGTWVATQSGFVPIEALKPQGVEGIPDDEGGMYYPVDICVQTPDGLQRASHFYDSGVRPTRTLTTRAGYTLTGTLNHPVLVLTPSGEKVWKPLGELACGDFVAVQRHEAVWGNSVELPEFHFDYYWSNKTYQPTLPSRMTPELAYALGILAGDGNLTRKNYVNLSSSDPEIVDTFYAFAESVGLKARYRADYDHVIGSAVLNAWLKHIGLSGYAHEKQVPYTVLRAPRDCVRAFLQGLFDTDGHAEAQRGYIQYVSSSEKLARQVHALLLQFGIVAKLGFKPNNHRGSWSIRITGDAARRFYDRIGFRLERKQSRRHLLPARNNANLDAVPYLPRRVSSFPKALNYTRYFRGEKSPTYATLQQIAVHAPEVRDLLQPEFYWDEIVSLEDGGLRHCYDLTVPNGHAFVTNGIVSHNTSFLLSVALNSAMIYNARVVIFTMEMGHEQLVQRLLSMDTGIDSQRLRTGKLDQKEWARFVRSSGRLASLPIFIDDTPAMTPLQMRTKCRRLVHEFGIDLVIIDYLQLMSAGGQYENNRVQEISYISRSIKELARELNVPVFSAAQLSRAVEQRQDKRPQLSDLRESGSIEQDSDVVIFLYRDVVYNEATEFPNRADLIIAKHRNGPTGVVSLHFNKSLTKFSDALLQTVDLSGL